MSKREFITDKPVVPASDWQERLRPLQERADRYAAEATGDDSTDPEFRLPPDPALVDTPPTDEQLASWTYLNRQRAKGKLEF